RTIGGPKLAPRISPKKTWAGFIGGVLAAAGASWAIASLSGSDASTGLVVYGGLLAALSQGGDLMESWVKRRFHVKDSSNIIPGHGGLLDRVDALLVVATVTAFVAFLSDGNPFAAGG
ncbi:MAG: phosphatidate cytidylyltransferase, partial [Rhodospirillales bacterium]